MSYEWYLSKVRDYVERADETDYIMPIWLPFIPAVLTPMVTAIMAVTTIIFKRRTYIQGPHTLHMSLYVEERKVFLVLPWFISIALIVILSTICVVIGLYVLYKWIKRRNEHLRRAHRLYENVVNCIKAKELKGVDVLRLEDLVREMKDEEIEERNPILWIVLTLVFPPIVLYIYHFLNKDFHKHERREIRYYTMLSTILKQRTPEAYIPEFEPRVPDRNTIIYLVLMLVTLGFFGIYWIYTLTRDPNEHFKEHKKVEKKLVEALEKL